MNSLFIHLLNKKILRAYHVPGTVLSEHSRKENRQGLLFLVMVKSKKQKKALEITERQSMEWVSWTQHYEGLLLFNGIKESEI